MTSFYYYDKNPSGFCFLVLIRAFVIQTSLGLQNLNMKGKTKRILVVVVKWRHHANGLLSYFTLVCLWCGRTEGGTGVRSRDHQNLSDEWLTNFSWYRTLACACGSPERGASLSLKQEVVLDFSPFSPLYTEQQISLPFHVSLLVKSLPIYIPEAEKRWPLRWSFRVHAIIGSTPPPPPRSPLTRALDIHDTVTQKRNKRLLSVYQLQ